MGKIQKARSSALLGKVVNELFAIPATTIPHVMKALQISYNSAKNNIQKLVELGILSPQVPEERPQWFYSIEIIRISAAADA